MGRKQRKDEIEGKQPRCQRVRRVRRAEHGDDTLFFATTTKRTNCFDFETA